MLGKHSIVVIVALVLATLCFPAPAKAQVMGICTGWTWAAGSTSCTVATPALEIGTSTNPNPTFQIAINGGGTTVNTMLIVLVPNTSTSSLNFTARFNGMAATGLTTVNWSSGTLLSSALSLTLAGGGGPTDYSISGGGGGALSGVQSVPGVTSYGVYAFTIGQGVSDPNSGGAQNISVSFGNFTNGSGFPLGTIFLAVGLNSSGQVTYTTPLTLGVESVSTPEPGEMPQLLLGLLFVGAFLGRRYLGVSV